LVRVEEPLDVAELGLLAQEVVIVAITELLDVCLIDLVKIDVLLVVAGDPLRLQDILQLDAPAVVLLHHALDDSLGLLVED